MATAVAFAIVVSVLNAKPLLAACGDKGGGVSGSEGAELARRVLEETIEKAKANAGLSSIPVFTGVAVGVSRLDHDGFRLKTPVTVTPDGCGSETTITKLSSFETSSASASVLGELDLTRWSGLGQGTLFKVGAAVGGKWLETKTTGSSVIVDGKRTASRLEEDGVQVDLYSLLAFGTSYVIASGSFGGGDATLTSIGTGETDYRNYAISATLGNVFTLDRSPHSRTLLDVSGGLMWSSYKRDGFTDSRGAIFGDAETDEFAGKAEVKLAYQVMQEGAIFTPYIKGGVKHRFDYDDSFAILHDPSFDSDFSGPFVLTSDDTFWRAGGGLGFSFDSGNITGVIDGTYQASGDSSEVIGKAQLIFRLN